MHIEWQEVDVEAIMKWYVEGFQVKEGQGIHRYEWFFDAAKGKVIFRLYVHDGSEFKLPAGA